MVKNTLIMIVIVHIVTRFLYIWISFRLLMLPDPCLCICFYRSGDRHSLSSLAFKTARPADES